MLYIIPSYFLRIQSEAVTSTYTLFQSLKAFPKPLNTSFPFILHQTKSKRGKMARTIGIFAEIPRMEESVRKNMKNKLWLKGGLIAVSILWCISLIFLFLFLILNEETKLVFREVATFPLSQLYYFVTNSEIESSTLIFFIFFFLNSVFYFLVGALIGFLSQKIIKMQKTKRR